MSYDEATLRHAGYLPFASPPPARRPCVGEISGWRAAAGHTPRDRGPQPRPRGHVVPAASDELESLPLPGASRQDTAYAPAGQHWYRFEFDSAHPKLVFFQVELM